MIRPKWLHVCGIDLHRNRAHDEIDRKNHPESALLANQNSFGALERPALYAYPATGRLTGPAKLYRAEVEDFALIVEREPDEDVSWEKRQL